jgi:hypothetical protein
MQGIYTYIPETMSLKEYNVAAIPSLLFMVLIIIIITVTRRYNCTAILQRVWQVTVHL